MQIERSLMMETGRYKMTRGQVAVQLGVSPSTVRRMEFTKLNPVADERGVFRFDPEEVAAVAERLKPRRRPRKAPVRRKDAGKVAARVFKLFARGWNLPRIVSATKETPERVRGLFHDWTTSLQEGELERRAHLGNVAARQPQHTGRGSK